MPTSFNEIEAQIDSLIALGLETGKPFQIRINCFGDDMYALKLQGENNEFLSPKYETNLYDLAKCLKRKLQQLRSK